MALPICAEFIVRFFFEVIRFMLEHLLLTLILFLLLLTGRLSWILYGGVLLIVNIFNFIPLFGDVAAITFAPIIWGLATLNSPAHWGLKLLGLFPMMLIGFVFQIATVPSLAAVDVVVNIVETITFFGFNYILYRPNRDMANLILIIPSAITIIWVGLALLLSLFIGFNFCGIGNSALMTLEKGREFFGFQEPGFLTKTIMSLIKGVSILP